MDILFRIWRYLSLVAIAAAFLIFIVIFSVRNEICQNDNYDYLPSDALWVIKFDVNELVSKGFYDLYKSEDKVFTDLKKLFQEGMDQYDKESDGVLYTSDVYVFEIPLENTSINGTMYNLIDQGQFDNFYADKKHFVVASNSSVGVVFDKPLDPTLAQSLQNKAKGIVSSPGNSSASIRFKEADGVFVSTYLNKDKLPKTAQQDINVAILGDNLSFEVSMPAPFKIEKPAGDVLKPNGLNVTVKAKSEEFDQTYKGILRGFGITQKIPTLEALSVNYRGMLFEDNGDVIFDGEVLMEFQEIMDFQSISAFISNEVPMTLQGDRLNFGIFSMYAVQLSPNRILLKGKREFKPIFEQGDFIMRIKGDPNNFVTVKGSSMMRTLIHSLEWFGITRDYVEDVEYIDIQATSIKNDMIEMKGIIKPKKDKSLLLKSLKVTLENFKDQF